MVPMANNPSYQPLFAFPLYHHTVFEHLSSNQETFLKEYDLQR